ANLKVGVAAEDLALGGAGFELSREHADRDAGRTFDAARAVRNGLAAAEADSAQRIVEFAGVASAVLSKHLPLHLARKVRARARDRHNELRDADCCALTRTPRSTVSELFMRLVNG